MGAFEGMVAADMQNSARLAFLEKQRQFGINQNRMDNNSNIVQQQFLANQQRDNERLNASIAQQNADREIRSFQLQEANARQKSKDARDEEMFNKYTLPYEEAKLQSLKDTQAQQRQEQQAREERKALLKEEGLIDLVAGLRMGLPIQKIGDKFNSRGQAKAQKIDYNADTREVHIIDGDGNPQYISPEMFDEIASYEDSGYASTGKSGGTRSGSNSRSIRSDSGKSSAPKEWNPKDEVEALKGLDELISTQQGIVNHSESTGEQKKSAIEKIRIYNEKIDKINSRSDEKPNPRVISYSAQGNNQKEQSQIIKQGMINGQKVAMYSDGTIGLPDGSIGIVNQDGTIVPRNTNPSPRQDKYAITIRGENNNQRVSQPQSETKVVASSPDYKQPPVMERVDSTVGTQAITDNKEPNVPSERRATSRLRLAMAIDPMPEEGVKGLDPYYSKKLAKLQNELVEAPPSKQKIIAEKIIQLKQTKIDAMNSPDKNVKRDTSNRDLFRSIGKGILSARDSVYNYPSPFVN